MNSSFEELEFLSQKSKSNYNLSPTAEKHKFVACQENVSRSNGLAPFCDHSRVHPSYIFFLFFFFFETIFLLFCVKESWKRDKQENFSLRQKLFWGETFSSQDVKL